MSGAIVSDALSDADKQPAFYPWLPSTWPQPPADFDDAFAKTVREIFEETMLSELVNVIGDINGDLQHRGHVVGISMLCALDAVSSYGYGANHGAQIPIYVCAHFPAEYHPHAKTLLNLYRHVMIHNWNLFGAAILPGSEPPAIVDGILVFRLLRFFDALKSSVEHFFKELGTNKNFQGKTLSRYSKLRRTARHNDESEPNEG